MTKTLILSFIAAVSIGSFARADQDKSNGSSAFNADTMECRGDSGSVFKLIGKDDQTYDLEYATTVHIFGDGRYRISPIIVATGLKCSSAGVASSFIDCTGQEELVIDVPRAGVRDRKVTRESSFKIGMGWGSETRFDGLPPRSHLTLGAHFRISLPLGEHLRKISVEATNTKTGEKTTLDLDRTTIGMELMGEKDAGCTATPKKRQ